MLMDRHGALYIKRAVLALLFLCLMVVPTEALDVTSPAAIIPSVANNSSAQIVGGAVTPDLFSGRIGQSYPIAVPSGRKGLQPNIALTYSGNTTNGWLGIGWDLEVGSIQRQVKDGVDYTVDDYVFKSAGGMTELVKLPGTEEYRAKLEGGYVKFQKIGSDPSSYWKVTDKSGQKMFFGQTSAEQQVSSTNVYRWCLDRVEDPHGNYISYEYSKDSGQIYLSRISYVNHANLSAFNENAEIIFHLDSDRSDKLLSYLPNFEVKTNKRLSSIEINANNQLFVAYKLSYDSSELTNRSRLVSVQKFGADASVDSAGVISDGISLPQTVYTYSLEALQFNPVAGPTVAVANMATDAAATADDLQRLRFADFNGDGKVDMIRINGSGSIDLYYSDGTNLVEQNTVYYEPVPSETDVSFELSGFQVGDFNGDGRADIVQVRPGSNVPMHIYFAEAGGFSSIVFGPLVTSINMKISLIQAMSYPYINYKLSYLNGMARLHLGDYNGDGKTDIGWVASEYGASAVPMKIFLSDGNDFTEEISGPNVALRAVEQITPSNYNSFEIDEDNYIKVMAPDYWNFTPIIDLARVFTGDFDGNGKTDIAIAGDGGNTRAYLSNGNGFPNEIIGPYFAKAYYPQKINYLRVGDFNGDSKSDFARFFAYPDDGSGDKPVQIHLSNGAGFQPVLYGPPMHVWYDATFADFNGDGKTDIIELPNDFSGVSTGIITQPINIQLAQEPSGNQFLFKLINGPSHTIDLNQGLHNVDLARINYGDISGDGQLDIIRVNGADSSSSLPMDLFLSSEYSAFPSMLKQIDNGLGGTTSIDYKFSSDVDNNGNLPLVLPLVESVISNDGNGNVSTTDYEFSSGYFHKGEKEFRGFNYAKVTGPLGSSGDREIDETWFHQGDGVAVDDNNPGADEANMQGRPYKQRTSGSDGTVYAEVQTSYHADLDSGPVYFNPPAQVDSYGQNGTSSSFHTRVKTESFDLFGNPLVQINAGDVTTALDDVTTEKSYIYNTTDYLVGLVESETLYEGSGTGGAKKAQASYYYDESFSFPATTAPMSNLTHSSSAPTLGNLTSIVHWNDRGADVEEYLQYDAYGNPIKQRDGNGNISEIRYDPSHTFPLQKINSLGHTETTVYYGVDGQASSNGLYGQPYLVTDANGASVTYVYDKLGRATKETLTDGSWTETQYLDFGTVGSQHVYATNSFGLWSRSYFDGANRPYIEMSSGPDGKTLAVHTIFDARGLAYQSSLPYFYNEETPQYSTINFDTLARKVQVDLPDGSRQLSCYENTVQVTIDADNHRRRQTMDAHGRLSRVEEYQGEFTSCSTGADTPFSTTGYAYDASGNLTQVTDTYGNLSQMGYDSLGRKVFMRDPDMGDWSYSYDSNGNLVYQRDAKGQVITFNYDALSRVTRKSYPTSFDSMLGFGGSGENTFAFISNDTDLYYPIAVDGTGQAPSVPAETDVVYSYDDPAYNYAIGKLTRMDDGSGSTEYYYDHPMDLTTRTIKNIGAESYTITSETDALGRLQSITYPDSEKVDYSYDGSYLTNVGTNGQYATYGSYNAFGSTTQVDYGTSGVFANYTYNSLNGRLQTAKVSNATGELGSRSYQYENGGNISVVADLINANRSQNFTYDELSRLKTASSTVYGGLNYQYDKIGNLTSKDGITYTSDTTGKPHQLVSSSDDKNYQYDANGNMASDGVRTIAYNADNLPVLIQSGTNSIDFEYDGNGSRVRKGSTIYVDNLYECTGSGCAKYIFAGSERIAIKSETGELTYYHPDHLGGTSLMTQDGGVVEDLFYKPLGETVEELTGGFGPKHQFTGQEFDAESGLYFYNARYYNPVIGRFVSADSIVPYPDDSQSFNRYSYVRNNPVNLVDPSGHADTYNAYFGMTATAGNGSWSGSTSIGGIPVDYRFSVSRSSSGSGFGGAWNHWMPRLRYRVVNSLESRATMQFQHGNYFAGAINVLGIAAVQMSWPEKTVVDTAMVVLPFLRPIKGLKALKNADRALAVAKASKGRGLWKITKEGTDKIVQHKNFGKFYRHKKSKLWWSKDTAGHGKSKWKVFEETDKGLKWKADADIYGDIIEGKHKSNTGKFIKWSEIGGK